MARNVFYAIACILTLVAPAGAQPNIVVIMADDLNRDAFDALIGAGLMPELEARVIQQGVSFANAFVTNPICCPSRATYLTGQYAHNHRVYTNISGISWDGWFPDGADPGLEARALPVWLQSAGYVTAHIGKYLNGYGVFAPDGVSDPLTWVPPGWDDWQGLIDPTTYKMFGYQLNDNGSVVTYGDLEADYQTDVIAARAVQFIQAQSGSAQPFFLNIAPLAPHTEVAGELRVPDYLSDNDPFGVFRATVRPAPRHEILIDGDPGNGEVPSLAIKPSFNEDDVSDKVSCPRPEPQPGLYITYDPLCVGDRPPLDPVEHQPQVESQYKAMLASMVAFDEMIGAVLDALEAIDVMDDTVIVFTSDNGWFYAEHRLSGKSLSYDEAARVPLAIRAPSAVAGAVASQVVLNNDLAPTIAALAGATPLILVDGASIAPLLTDPAAAWFRRNFLIENWFQPGYWKFTMATSYSLRILRGDANFLYINVHAEPEQPGLATGYELYDLDQDPFALDSFAVPQSFSQAIAPFMDFFKSCEGSACRFLEGF